MSSEAEWKAAVQHFIVLGIYPSPGVLQRYLGANVTNNINGRQCRWREEILGPWCDEHPFSEIAKLHRRRHFAGASVRCQYSGTTTTDIVNAVGKAVCLCGKTFYSLKLPEHSR